MSNALRREFLRIIAALRARFGAISRVPPISELEFISITKNHGEFSDKLRILDQASAAAEVHRHAVHVGLCWLRLGVEHLEDARAAVAAKRPRSAYSRAYYAAYNVSKGMRYVIFGGVSLKGDDHHKASDLPDDFPDGDPWSEAITTLYEHRLRADYDNWSSTMSDMTLSPDDAIKLAVDFVDAARRYLSARFGVTI